MKQIFICIFVVFRENGFWYPAMVNSFLELLHINEAAAGKLSNYSCMSSSIALSEVMLPFLYFTKMISVRVLDGRASGF